MIIAILILLTIKRSYLFNQYFTYINIINVNKLGRIYSIQINKIIIFQ